MKLKSITNSTLVEDLKKLVRSERKVTAQILVYIREVDRRRLYLEYRVTSLFAFLTKEMGYTKAAAQRRVEASRLLKDVPSIKTDLESGALNLSQVAMVAQSIRQKTKEKPDTELTPKAVSDILSAIKNKDVEESQRITAKALDIKIKTRTKKTTQQDGSVRVETTFSAEDILELDRVKELISHTHPNPTLNELVNFLAKFYLERKDPLRKLARAAGLAAPSASTPAPTPTPAPAPSSDTEPIPRLTRRAHIPTPDRRAIFKRDQACQWRDKRTGQMCGSKFQLEIDHKHSVWMGGGNEIANLQALCRVHNVLKYRQETGTE